ncbi:MAG: hypothetical protein AAF368_14410, partial [Planctomycetota bacterium]
HLEVRGMTISCQTWGREWGTDGFGAELDRLQGLGVNWVSIHPYASIGADGSVRYREIDPEDPPTWLARPIREAHERGMSIFIKPHLAYWGSPFSWRGAIQFEDKAKRERFFAEYSTWITQVAAATHEADAFAIGTELEGMIEADDTVAAMRALTKRVREVTNAHLTYAANWTEYPRVRFWDELDVIGVQAYFPLSEEEDPEEEALRRGWQRVLADLRQLSEKTGKPVVFTELGYDSTADAAVRPWEGGSRRGAGEAALALQERCTRVALQVLKEERDWLRGSFLWKWFVGSARRADFKLDTPRMRAVLAESWLTEEAEPQEDVAPQKDG